MSATDTTDDAAAKCGHMVRECPWWALNALCVLSSVTRAQYAEPCQTHTAGLTRPRHYVIEIVPVTLTYCVVCHITDVCHVRVYLTLTTRPTDVDVAVVGRERLASNASLTHGIVVGTTGGDYPQAWGTEGAAPLAIQVVLVWAAPKDTTAQLQQSGVI